ncbi:hypothetical protein RN001_002767 [Aquatica leii]|uniref:ABC transporter domain-containing protein n=1 Tax=Aquatica leii TaxID=1421715 RepID=A0AAN7PMT4_9COLE|nr:hypothetical protein RN001_002767 [Aquatica leii]
MTTLCNTPSEPKDGKKLLKKQLTRIAKTPPVNIEFQDLEYSVREGGFKRDQKNILKSISGKFSAGELTAILGPSGSGKTTLLNILAGYVTSGVTGTISVNGRPRNLKQFNKISAYIMQDDLLPQLMTVEELMMVATKLKLGDKITIENKKATINEILSVLGLDVCRNVRTEALSGGQRKRLSVALELVNNPPVIFLDEPTSGLDTVCIKQSIDIFEVLTAQGRTVICTIHQPPASIFQRFDQTYFLANGICVYNGSTPDIVPHLSSIGIVCPVTYTPAEYIIELVHDNDKYANDLSSTVQNGKLNKRTMNISRLISVPQFEKDMCEEILEKSNFNFPTSFWSQFYILYSRMLLQLSRNRTGMGLQLFSHCVAGGLLGSLFFGIGNNAEMAVENFFFCLSVLMFFIFTYLMTPALTYPSEIKILKREYFNRWYSLKPYYLAVTFQNMPLLLTLGILIILVTYGLSFQPVEASRFFYFAFAGLLLAVATEGLGLAVGSIFNVGNGTVVASSVAAPLIILCVYGMGYGSTIEPHMKIIMGISYVRFAVVAGMTAIFENRGPFDCFNEIYCYYKDPNQTLKDLGMLNASYGWNMLGLVKLIRNYGFDFFKRQQQGQKDDWS